MLFCRGAGTCSWRLRHARKGHLAMAAGSGLQTGGSVLKRDEQLTWDQCPGSYLKESWSLVR
jgi:hypothetical protein